ncbi:protease [Mucilaginibacter agri]|uniref:Protease n=1 Tax=Mucilaginibacter agri TaxID=2695265 RepID=A0A965ZID6_9SPHI|nr:protease [Mucilaginibacter agri]NCD71659.1 protease [Mucilaginibacter agri]
MKSYQLLTAAALLALASCHVKSKTTTNATATGNTKADSALQADITKPADKALYVTMRIKKSITIGDSVLLKFTVHNPENSAQQFCKWHTPFEPLMSKYLEIKDESGVEADYRGAMAKRIMPPPASSYIKVNPRDSLSATVDLLKGFAITKPGKYTVTYVGQNMSGLFSDQSVSFEYVKK